MLLLKQTREFENSDQNIFGWKKPFECWEVVERGWVEFYEASVKGEPGIMEPEPGREMTATNAKHSHT